MTTYAKAFQIPRLNSQMLAWHTDWESLFGARRPLIVEIGFGRGHYLSHLARQHPDASIIGLEISNECLDSAERMIVREQISNVRLIHATAETALHHLFESASIQQIHINFPDPWFKKNHHHRRLMQADTLALLVERLAPHGELYLATDILDYAEMTGDLLETTMGIVNRLPTAWANTLPGRTITKYEAIAQREGRDCYYFAYQRTADPVPPIPVIKELDMPHAVITLPLDLATITEQFTPIKYAHGETHIHLMDAFFGRSAVLVETHIGEPTLRQHIMIGIYITAGTHDADPAQTPSYTIQLSSIGQPRATEGVHIAVALLRDWVLSLHPHAHLVKQKIKEKALL